MVTADGVEHHHERGNCQPAIGSPFCTDPRTIWQFFASNADSSGQRKMTPTCIVNRKYPKVRDASSDIESNVLKSRKKKRRNGVISLPSEQPQLGELLTGQDDMIESGTGDTTKKKKKKKRVNKSVKRRLALAAIMELNLIITGSENRCRGSVNSPTDITLSDSSGIYNSSSTVTAPYAADRLHSGSYVRGEHSHYYSHDLNDIHRPPHGRLWNAPTALPKPTASNAIPIESYRALQVSYVLFLFLFHFHLHFHFHFHFHFHLHFLFHVHFHFLFLFLFSLSPTAPRYQLLVDCACIWLL